MLAQLHVCGVRLSIDDFGTGYSSLSYLKRIHTDKLKIDQSFVRDLEKVGEDATLVEAMINMARSLRVTTVAEGVETAGQLALLRRCGCDEVQGFLFSRPLPVAEFEAWLLAHEEKLALRKGDKVEACDASPAVTCGTAAAAHGAAAIVGAGHVLTTQGVVTGSASPALR